MSEVSRKPLLSVVLCTNDEAEQFRATLESLCRQTLARAAFEVVLVEHGSRDVTRDLAASFASRLPLRYAFQQDAGLGAARNVGVSMARADVVLFLDDDVADPGLLDAHVGAHRRRPETEVAVLGHTRLAPELETDPLMHFVTEVGCFLFAYPGIEEGKVLDFTYFWGGRSSCKRSFLLDHGGFDPVFQSGGDDIELGYRLSKHGFRVVYEPSALSTMVRGIGFDGFCRRMERHGRSNVVFSRLHAEEIVQQWTEVRGAAEAWRRLGPVYELLRRSGRELDRIARVRLEAGLGLDATDAELLYGAYWTAFEASRVKGTAEKALESEGDLAAGRSEPRNAAAAP